MKVLFTSCVTMVITSIVIRTAADSPGALVAVETEDDADGSVEDDDDTAQNAKVHESFLDESAEPFIPSQEWQDVKPGQSIPPGLHVRLNLETGRKEAKLLDEEVKQENPQNTDKIRVTDGTEPTRLQKMKQAIEAGMKKFDRGQSSAENPLNLNYWKAGDKEGMASSKDYFSRDDLKKALKNFKATKADAREEKVPSTATENNFRSMETLKKDLKDTELSLKTDPEIIQGLLSDYHKEGATVANKQALLTDLEYYVHQIDNGQDFVDMGGMTLLIEELNHTESGIREQAAFVLGSAVQSNPKVQVKALESGAMQQLLKMFSTEMSEQLESRVLYGLSALVRHFPPAQQKLVELGGVHSLTQLLLKSNTKIKVKAVTLVNDLITEKVITEEQSKTQATEALEERLNQYNVVHLRKNVVEQGWCDLVPPLLTLPEHDAREKILTAMHTLLPSCAATFTKVIPSLRTLREEYSVQAQQEALDDDTDSYFRDFFHKISEVLLELEQSARKIEL